jgi:hypothetical protein
MDLHDDGDEQRRTHALEQDIGERLKDRIRDEEHRERGIIISTTQKEILGECIDLGVTNIGTVQERQQVEKAKL